MKKVPKLNIDPIPIINVFKSYNIGIATDRRWFLFFTAFQMDKDEIQMFVNLFNKRDFDDMDISFSSPLYLYNAYPKQFIDNLLTASYKAEKIGRIRTKALIKELEERGDF